MQSPDEAAAMKAVDAAFKSGVNFFDVAPFYASGDAERVWVKSTYVCSNIKNVGTAMLSHSHMFKLICMLQLLGRAIKHLPRDQIIVATKVGKYIAGEPADFSAARVTKSVHESLERMQLKHIDLIQVHDIEFAEDMRQVRVC